MQWKVEMRRITLVKSVIKEATHTMLPYSLYIMWMVHKTVEGIVLYLIQIRWTLNHCRNSKLSWNLPLISFSTGTIW